MRDDERRHCSGSNRGAGSHPGGGGVRGSPERTVRVGSRVVGCRRHHADHGRPVKRRRPAFRGARLRPRVDLSRSRGDPAVVVEGQSLSNRARSRPHPGGLCVRHHRDGGRRPHRVSPDSDGRGRLETGRDLCSDVHRRVRELRVHGRSRRHAFRRPPRRRGRGG